MTTRQPPTSQDAEYLAFVRHLRQQQEPRPVFVWAAVGLALGSFVCGVLVCAWALLSA